MIHRNTLLGQCTRPLLDHNCGTERRNSASGCRPSQRRAKYMLAERIATGALTLNSRNDIVMVDSLYGAFFVKEFLAGRRIFSFVSFFVRSGGGPFLRSLIAATNASTFFLADLLSGLGRFFCSTAPAGFLLPGPRRRRAQELSRCNCSPPPHGWR